MPGGVIRPGMWANGPLPRPIADYACLLSIFVIFSAYKYFFQVQVELGDF